MPLLKFDYNRARFLGADGKLHEVRGCPLPHLIELRELFALLELSLAELGVSFSEAYIEDAQVKAVCDRLLELNGIDPDWCSLPQLTGLLLFQEDPKAIRPGLLLELNGMVGDKAPVGKSVSLEEYTAQSIVSLVGLGLAQNLADAQEIALSMPADQLEAFIVARSHQLNPESAEKQEQLEGLDSLVEDMKRDFAGMM